jgi:subtilisin family serine protease
VQAFEEPEEEAPAHLINHSHTFGNGYYGPENQGYDAFTAMKPTAEGSSEGSSEGSAKTSTPRPAVFAAGNNGFGQQAELLILRGYYGLMVNFKNLLVVGALESNDAQHADFSSLGPTLDGRLKPDLAAPGSSDARPLNGFSIQVGELRLHAREGSGARDRVWYWSEPSGWSGEGGLNPNDEQRPASVEAGVLSGFTFGNSWQTRLGWEASETDAPIDPRLYDQLSFEVRFEVPEQPSALTTPTDRPPLPLSYNLPEAFFVGWADDEGERLDDFNYFAYGELTEGEWRRVRVPLGGEGWAGEDLKSIHRLMITPGLYISGVYTPSIDGGYTISSGTSMASPAAAGVLALTLEQLAAQGRYELEKRPPSPATTRALLNHTARDLIRDTPPGRAYPNPDTGVASRYSEGPDWNTGYGLIDAWAARRLMEADAEAPRWLEGEVSPGEVLRLPLELTEGGELTVSLAWDDPAAALLLEQWAPHLIHDLDLAVVGPLSESGESINSTKAYGPWVLTPPPLHSERYTSGEDEFTAPFVLPAARCERPSLEALWSGEPREGFEPAPLEVDEDGFVPRLNRGCVDELNTYEQVRFSVPSAGRYELVVRGAPLSGEPLEGEAQPFTLMWSQSCALTPSN